MNFGANSPNQALVSVVIPTYNRDLPLRQTLRSLIMSEYPNFEIIVIDQSDKVFRPKKTYLNRKNLKIFYCQPPNAAVARNIGISKAKGEIIIFLDDDVICQKNLLECHAKNYANPLVGAVAGRMIDQQQNKSRECRTGQVTWYGKFTDGFGSLKRQKVMTVMTCNASWRRQVLCDLGGFDEYFTGPVREDSDLSLRTIKAGYQIVFDPTAAVIHRRAKTGGFRKSEGRLRWYRGFFKNETYFFLKHRLKILLPFILLTRADLAARCMFGFGREISLQSLLTPWRGIIDGFRTYQRWQNENRG